MPACAARPTCSTGFDWFRHGPMLIFRDLAILIVALALGAGVVLWLMRKRQRRSDPRAEPGRAQSPGRATNRAPPMPRPAEAAPASTIARPLPSEIDAIREEPIARELPRDFPPAAESTGAGPTEDLEASSGAAASSRDLGPGPTSAPAEAVKLGASAPASARPGDEFTARFVAYLASDEGEVSTLLNRLSPHSEHRLGVKECQWKRGTAVSVRLSGRHLEVSPAEQSFVWDGTRALLEFDVAVAAAAPQASIVLKFDVLVDGIVVAGLRMDLQIAADGAVASTAPAASATTHAARSAFASYSSKDRERVLDRLAAVRIATGLDVFLDCLALNPGEQWKPRLESEILSRDLFLLFWSSESAASQWVDWEWRTALARKGRDAMQIHPMASGVKPPAELKDLHFGDVYMLVREATEARRNAPA